MPEKAQEKASRMFAYLNITRKIDNNVILALKNQKKLYQDTKGNVVFVGYQKNNYLFEKPYNNYVFSTGYAQMRPYENGYFLISLVQTNLFVKSVLDRCTGTSYPAINSNDLADIKVHIPKETEQTQIGTFFAHLDNLITHHQCKLEKLQDIKKDSK